MFNVEFSVREIRDAERKEGIKEGIKEGRQKGQFEKAVEIAKNFLKMGLSPEKVAEGTGLSENAILEIKQEADMANNK